MMGGPPGGNMDRRNRSRSRGRGGGRGGGGGRGMHDRDRGGRNDRGGPRGGYRNDEEYYGHRRRSSLSPPSRYLTREEEERRRKDREQQDIERDQRTVFACQIHPKCDERDIFEFFSEIGKVIDVQLIRDNRTFKSKGYVSIILCSFILTPIQCHLFFVLFLTLSARIRSQNKIQK